MAEEEAGVALVGKEYWEWRLKQPEIVKQQEREAERWRSRDMEERGHYRKLAEHHLLKLHAQQSREIHATDPYSCGSDLRPETYRHQFRYQLHSMGKEHDLWALDNSRDQARARKNGLRHGDFISLVDFFNPSYTRKKVQALVIQAACEEDALLERLVPHWRRLERERSYQYEPLASPSHFRLLELHPDSCDDPVLGSFLHQHSTYFQRGLVQYYNGCAEGLLVCSLHNLDLDSSECPMFEALSYEWCANAQGDKDPAKECIVIKEGSEIAGIIEVSANLTHLLRRLRRDGHRWVWADAACINQNSSQEKGHQVRLMGRIYTTAERVLAWLSPRELLPYRGAPGDFDMQSLLSIPTEEHLSTLLQFYATGKWAEHPPQEYQYYSMSQQVTALYRKAVSALVTYFRLPFWKRKWIIQEILLASTVVLMTGGTEVPMKNVEDFFARLEDAYASTPLAKDHIPIVRSWPVARLAMHRRNRRLSKPYPQSLCDLLLMYRRNLCSVPLDHVYALYNLVGDHRKYLEIDYKQQSATWFLSVLLFLETHEHMAKNTMMGVVDVLRRLIHHDTQTFGKLTKQITAAAFDRGSVQLEEECANSLYLRRNIEDLHPGVQWTLSESSSGEWSHVGNDVTHTHSPHHHRVNAHVLHYFEIPGQNLCGLAAARLRHGDCLWQFLNTPLGLVVRYHRAPGNNAMVSIVSRCYLFDSRALEMRGNNNNRSQEAPPAPAMLTLEDPLIRGGQLRSRDLQLTIPDLLMLVRCVVDGED